MLYSTSIETGEEGKGEGKEGEESKGKERKKNGKGREGKERKGKEESKLANSPTRQGDGVDHYVLRC